MIMTSFVAGLVFFAPFLSFAGQAWSQPAGYSWSEPKFAIGRGTPIHDVVRAGDLVGLEEVFEFIELGILEGDVNATDHYGRTPLHWAAVIGNSSIVQSLIAHHAQVQVADTWGFTPLHLADNPESVEILLAHGANVHAVNKEGYTPLHFAAMHGSQASVAALIAVGANINAVARNKSTPVELVEIRCNAATSKAHQAYRKVFKSFEAETVMAYHQMIDLKESEAIRALEKAANALESAIPFAAVTGVGSQSVRAEHAKVLDAIEDVRRISAQNRIEIDAR